MRGLRAPGRAAAWQEGIDAALGARDLHAQWCMASPADFAQASRLRHVTSIRTSGDHGYLVGPEVLWAWFLHTNVMARALGLWPYKDVFHSTTQSATREVEALLAALSAGPVGIGDRIGEADVELIRRTCRADGVLVRPDVPIAAIDAARSPRRCGRARCSSGRRTPQHSAGRWGYVVTCNVGNEPTRRRGWVWPGDLGEDRPDGEALVVYDWRSGPTSTVRAGRRRRTRSTLEPAGWDYRGARAACSPAASPSSAIPRCTRARATPGSPTCRGRRRRGRDRHRARRGRTRHPRRVGRAVRSRHARGRPRPGRPTCTTARERGDGQVGARGRR